MVPELVAQLPEFRLPLVLEAELEGLLRDVVVQTLHPGVSPIHNRFMYLLVFHVFVKSDRRHQQVHLVIRNSNKYMLSTQTHRVE